MSADPGDLANLADLALPPPVSFWPPAIGSWILAAAGLAALAVFSWRALHRYRADAYLREAIAELDALSSASGTDAPARAAAISSILKRVALVRYGREQVASLTGADWTGFIARTAPQGASTDAIAEHLRRFLDPDSSTTAPEHRLLFAQVRAWLHGQRARIAAEA
jgi:hypothetical protein